MKPEKGDSLPAASPPPSPPASDEGSTAGKRGDAPAPGVGGDDGDDSDGDGNAAAAAPRGAESARAPRLLNAAAGEDAERAERAAEGQKASSTSGRPMDAPAVPARPRSLFVLVGPPDVHTAISVSAISYGVMCLLMVPVPVAMTSSGGFSFAESALVVQFHMIAMYAPSFFSGQLISRLGAATVQVLGALVIVAGTVVLLLGTSMAHYSVGEVLNVRLARSALLSPMLCARSHCRLTRVCAPGLGLISVASGPGLESALQRRHQHARERRRRAGLLLRRAHARSGGERSVRVRACRRRVVHQLNRAQEGWVGRDPVRVAGGVRAGARARARCGDGRVPGRRLL